MLWTEKQLGIVSSNVHGIHTKIDEFNLFKFNRVAHQRILLTQDSTGGDLPGAYRRGSSGIYFIMKIIRIIIIPTSFQLNIGHSLTYTF